MIFLLDFTKWNFPMNGAGATPLNQPLFSQIFSIMCSLKHDAPKFLSDRDERSLPSIIKAMKLNPRNLFALREG